MADQDPQTMVVGGLQTHVFGLSQAQSSPSVDIVFLLHGRTRDWYDMVPWAHRIISFSGTSSSTQRPLLAVTFDARNHGVRTFDEHKNQGWLQGNATHGQDMYSMVIGTSRDVSFLISFLPFFLFPDREVKFENVLCAGVSLGGHETYVVLSDDDRVKAGVSVIGCPSFPALMIPRATAEKRDERLPRPFLDLVATLDPKLEVISKKDVLILKGDEDKLVPWEASEDFVGRLPKEKAEVIGYPGVGHEFPQEMLEKSASWIVEWCQKQ